MDNFARQERLLAAACRTGDVTGVPDPRATVYRELVFNGIKNTLDRAYPVTRAALGDARWKQLIEHFLAHAALPSPELWKLPAALVSFTRESGGEFLGQYPFLVDLLRFEWEEIALYMMEDRALPPYRAELGSHPNGLVLNPHHSILQLEYPVFRTAAREALLHNQEAPFYVIGFRHLQTHRVHFIELASSMLQLCRLLHSSPCSCSSLAQAISVDESTVDTAVNAFFNEGLIIGVLANKRC